jgi:hypothetical protein
MDLLNWLGLSAFSLTLFALYLLGVPNRLNFIVFCVSYLIQMIIFMVDERWFLLAQMIVLFIFSLVNYLRWSRNGVG